MTVNEDRFYTALENIFTGANIEGEGGYVNLLKIKSAYYKKILKEFKKLVYENDIIGRFKEDFFDRLYTFFERYFSESGSVYFVKTAAWQKVYEQVYTDDKDVVLFWKTNMLYYVKSDIMFKNMEIAVKNEVNNAEYIFYFDCEKLQNKQNNEKKNIIFAYDKTENGRHFFKVSYSENGAKTKTDDILKAIKKSVNAISEDHLNKAFAAFKKQTSVDFFINKDAKKFLTEQLDMYLHQILLDEKNEFDAVRLAQLKTVKDFSLKIIDFVSQFEDELVRIWNKPKFVLNSNYVITINKLTPEIVEKLKAHSGWTEQQKEWDELGMLNKKENNFLFDNASCQLPIDTKYFKDLEIEILSLFDDLDEALDGRLIRSENYQALNTLKDRYKEKVQCIHIDPPYNTDTSGFLYKNNYRHASWLSMMSDRIDTGICLLNDKASFIVHIDENEYEHLWQLFDMKPMLPTGTIIWDKRNPMTGGSGIATQHEYIIWRDKCEKIINLDADHVKLILDKVKDLMAQYESDMELVRETYIAWLNTQTEFSNGEKAYRYIDNNGNVYQSVSLRAPELRTDRKFHIPLIHPKTRKPCPVPPNGFSRTPDTLAAMIERNEILFGDNEMTQPRQKSILKPEKAMQLTSIIQDATRGKADADKLGLYFPYNHSVKFYSTILSTATDKDSIILDYFAGSGTTAHAVIELNKKDCGRRKYMLVEVNGHFYSVILPRIKKVCYSDKWKEGISQDGGAGVSQFFKYYELEQYEQTLSKMKYSEIASALFDEIKPFANYVFLTDEKLAGVLDIDIKNNVVDLDFDKLYENIDFPETISLVKGKAIKKITANSVTLEDGEIIRYDYKNFADDEKIEFVKLLKPFLWWGRD